MRAALLPLLWPSLAAAGDATRFVWGVPVDGSKPSMLSLEPCDRPCVAVVRFDNTLVTLGGQAGIDASVIRAQMALDGVPLAVRVEVGGGLTPDRLAVLPPPGFAAQPREVLVDDNASGRVRVVLAPTS
jgi:hypothetical protein